MIVCIPAFNVERGVAGVVVRAVKYVDGVVVCDDGSLDLAGELLRGLGPS